MVEIKVYPSKRISEIRV